MFHFASKLITFERLRPLTAKARSFASSYQVTYSDYGDPRKVLQGSYVDFCDELNDSQVLVKMLMAPINPADINMVEGTYFLKPPLPAVCGNEGVGEVIEIGSSVKNLKPGDWVLPSDSGWGTWREMAIASESELVKIANNIPVLGAATITVNPTTAYRMLRDFVPLQSGDVIIQNGANSAVGQCVIQLAREMNVHTINVVRNRPDLTNLVDELKKLGANHVVTEEFCRSAQMKDLMKTLPAPPKLAFNGVGGKSSTELIRHLGQRGVMVTYGGMSKQPVICSTGAFIFKQIRLDGYWNTEWNRQNKGSKEMEKMFTDLCDLLHQGKLQPPKCSLIPLRQFSEAVQQAMEGFKSSKMVLVMNDAL